MKRILIPILLSLCLVACGGEEAQVVPNSATSTQETTPTTSIHYRVGSDITYEPFSFRNERNEPVGFEVDLLNAIGQAANFQVTFIHTPRSELVSTLNDDTFAIWSSTLSVSKERAERVDFSEPYIDFVRQIYILDKPENANLQSVADFRGKKIAVNGTSASAIEAAKELTGSLDNVIKTDSFFLSLSAVYTGKADGALGDSRILQYHHKKQSDIKTRMIDVGDEPKHVAFAVKKGNAEVLEKINAGLNAIKADGTYDKLVEKWFGKQGK